MKKGTYWLKSFNEPLCTHALCKHKLLLTECKGEIQADPMHICWKLGTHHLLDTRLDIVISYQTFLPRKAILTLNGHFTIELLCLLLFLPLKEFEFPI